MPSVKGRRILVTGAATGVGHEVAKLLAKKGAQLILWDINGEELEKTAALVRDLGAEVETCLVNLAEPESIAAGADKAGAVWGVINNAGIVEPKPFLESSSKRNELEFRVNTFAHLYTAKHFLPAMIEANSGAFVSVASCAAYFGAPKMVTYAASKAAAKTFIETLALEVAPVAPNVHLGVVCPSHIDTKLFEGFQKMAGSPTLQAVDVARSIVDDAIERSVPLIVLPAGVRFTAILRGLLPEGAWRLLMREKLKGLMTEHKPEHAEQIFGKMATSKL
jgi:short-subunit dehydrogenase